jgi:hypothetical protein
LNSNIAYDKVQSIYRGMSDGSFCLFHRTWKNGLAIAVNWFRNPKTLQPVESTKK